MRKIYAVMAVMLIASACNDTTAPVQKKVYPINLSVQSCANSKFSLSVEWAGKTDWQATFWRGTEAVAAIRDSNSIKNSGCVFSKGQAVTVNLYQFGYADYNATETSTVIN